LEYWEDEAMKFDDKLLKLNEINGIIVISPQVDFTASMERSIDDIYHGLCEKGYKKVLFEFLPKNHITSGGMAILFGLIRKSQKNGQVICITGLSKHFKKTFDMVGITRYTTIYESVEDALQKMSQPVSSCRD